MKMGFKTRFLLLCLLECFLLSAYKESIEEGAGAVLEDNCPVAECQNDAECPPTVIEPTFYGHLSFVGKDIPVLSLKDALEIAGMDPHAEPIQLDNRLVGYYSLDLSKLSALYRTEEGGIVCRLESDTDPFFLFVLDGETPASVQLFKKTDWTWTEAEYELLFDGKIPALEKKEFYRELAACFNEFAAKERTFTEKPENNIYYESVGPTGLSWQKDDELQESMHDISICPDRLTGLQFHISFWVTAYPDGNYIYSTPTQGTCLVEFDYIPPVTFYGHTRTENAPLPEIALGELLSEAGMDPEEDPQILLLDLPSGFYSLDLSQLIPIYVTETGEYVCRLESDPGTKLLFVLDGWESPTRILFYSKEGWSWLKEDQTLLLDELTPKDAELELCRRLVQAYAYDSDWDIYKLTFLDGEYEDHVITVCFQNIPGFQFNIPYTKQLHKPIGYQIYSTTRQDVIFIPHNMVTAG